MCISIIYLVDICFFYVFSKMFIADVVLTNESEFYNLIAACNAYHSFLQIKYKMHNKLSLIPL